MYEFLFIKSYHNELMLKSIENKTAHRFDFAKCFIYDSPSAKIEDYEDIKNNSTEITSVSSDVIAGVAYVNAQLTNDIAIKHNRVYYLNSDGECVLAAIILPTIRSEINIDLELTIESNSAVAS